MATNKTPLKIVLDPGAYVPERAHADDAGLDIRTPIEITVGALGSIRVDTGVHVQLPPNTVGMLKSKSGLNVNHDLICEGVIDENYRGSIVAKVHNLSLEPYTFKAGDKITQLVVIPILKPNVELCAYLDYSDRGEDGFGSTGR